MHAYHLPDESLGEAAELAARQSLGDDAYDDAVDAGRALDLAGIVELALDGAGT